MFCIYCGQKIKEGSSFCPYCGKKLHSKKEGTNSAAGDTSVAVPNFEQLPISSESKQYQQNSRKENQRKQIKSRWGLKLLLCLLACIIMTLGTICTLLYFEIADIPVVREIMAEIGIIQDDNSDDGTVQDSYKQDDVYELDATEDTATVEDETTSPTTEDPEEVAYRETVEHCVALAGQGEFDSAIAYLEEIIQQNSDSRYADLREEYITIRKQNLFATASDYASEGKYREAIQTMDAAWTNYADEDYYDAIVEYRQQFGIYNTSLFAVGKYNTVLLGSDGKVEICGDNTFGELAAGRWTDIVAVSVGDRHVVGLTKNGTVVAVGETKYGQCDVAGWKDIITISAGDVHTAALAENGTVYATGYNHKGQCNVNTLMNAAGEKRIVAVAAGYVHTLALLEDGSVVACGSNSYGECNVSGWEDIVAIYAGTQFSAGLKMDGTVVVTGQGTSGWDLSDWTDIVNMAAGDYYLIGLKADGTVVSVGVNSSDNPSEGQTNVSGLANIVFVGAGNDHTVAMNSDGTLLCIGFNKYGQCNYHGRTLVQ